MTSFEKASQPVKKNALEETAWTEPEATHANAVNSSRDDSRPARFKNGNPDLVFRSIEDLRSAMTRNNASGAGFLDFLLQGAYRAGKGVWVNPSAIVRSYYEKLIEVNPDLASE